MSFSASSTCDEVLAGKRLNGRYAVITGGSAGLGIETAKSLCKAGARVTIMARDAGKAEKVIADIRQQVPAADIDFELLDLSEQDSVRKAAEAIAARNTAIDMLINNAGLMACPLERNSKGFELQLATNHIGHFLWTCLLVPHLAEGARVVNLSSAGHKFSPLVFDDPNYESREYNKWEAYGQAKTANALFSVALNKRLANKGITANAVHPGAIITELGRHLSAEDVEQLSQMAPTKSMTYKTPEQGAATSVWAATHELLAGIGGRYLEDCSLAEPGDQSTEGGYMPHAVDHDDAERLWQLSEQWVGQAFDWR